MPLHRPWGMVPGKFQTRCTRALASIFRLRSACCSVVRTILPRAVKRRRERCGASPDAIPNANAVPFQVTVTTSGGAILVRRGLLGPGGRWRYSAEFCFAIFDPRRALAKALVAVADAVDYAYAVVGNE